MERLYLVLLLALVIDRIIGDPDWLWRRMPHPVVGFGYLIRIAECLGNQRSFSHLTRRINGFLVIFLLLFIMVLMGEIISWCCWQLSWGGVLLEAIIASLFLAQKSLFDHVRTVFIALNNDGVSEGRKAVSMIVGRDTDKLDEEGICRAAIESLAENSSDGIVAPVFWFFICGFPGLLAYKMLNTADSMIGHKNERYADFGYASAKLDDIANYLPARLTACLTILATMITRSRQSAKYAYQVMRQDARHHRSPNAGWPESVYAGALGISLSGPRYYGEQKVVEPFQNPDGHAPSRYDIIAALKLFEASMTLMTIGVACFYLILLSK